jgi:hypothetical protein
MVNGPPCQQCGYPLRWFAEQNAWGCDRCRQMFPAGPQPMRAAHAAHMVRGPGHKKPMMMWIALGGGAIAGVIIAIVIATGGGSGGSSAKGVAEAALAALSAGDGDKLAALADTENLYKSFVKCDADKSDESPAELAEKEKRRYAKAADRTKGLKLKLVDFPDIDKLDKDHLMTMPKGSKIAKGCTSIADASVIDTKIKVSVQDGDKPAVDQDVELELLEVGGKYYLARAPRIEKGVAFSAQLAKMIEFKDQMCACKDMPCATKVNADMATWAQANSAADAVPSDDEVKKIMAVSQDMSKCMEAMGKAAVAAATPPPPAPEPTLAAADLPKPCQEWKAGIDKLDHCAQIAKATVTALRTSYERSLAAWSKLPADSRTAVTGSCDSARDAVNNLLRAAGCN